LEYVSIGGKMMLKYILKK